MKRKAKGVPLTVEAGQNKLEMVINYRATAECVLRGSRICMGGLGVKKGKE